MKPAEIITYELDEKCPLPVLLATGLQGVVISLPPTVLTISLFAQASGLGEGYRSWALMVAIMISGVGTALQSRMGRWGGAHTLIMGAVPSYIAVALLALNEASPETLASLVVVASVFQFSLAFWLPLLRRIVTPVVSSIVIMLVAAGVMHIAVERLGQVQGGGTQLARRWPR